ncbi:MAG: NADH-quinone oxidoreductase subunit J [Alphaproteobacteria bacterium]|nr:NADH-quinone oxidoreductase subunit J [Alphaproteobacteria bacterium]
MTPGAAVLPCAGDPAGALLVLAIVLPTAGFLLALSVGGGRAERVALLFLAGGFAVAIAIVAAIWRSGHALSYALGGWTPPLGIALRADGLSAVMAMTTALVVGAVALFGRQNFAAPAPGVEARVPLSFWTLLLAVTTALNLIWFAGDLFSLYVALELLTFTAVPLVCLDGRADTLEAALRYMLFALMGSVLYLLGTALLYSAYGTLDIALLSERVRPEPAVWTAAALMTAGLVAKTALFPLHLWLPPAHAGAPPAASALLSALVVKGSFFLLVRLWFDVLPGLPSRAPAELLAALGAAAVLMGSVLALRQARLKLLIAYSTVAQIGYLFLMFPLASGPAGGPVAAGALTGGMLQAVSHATAKAAMFMAAGVMAGALGHDRIAGLAGTARALPMSMFAFGLGGAALIGLPPSGGFLAKWLLLTASVQSGQWWWAAVMLTGGLFTCGYVFMVVGRAMGEKDASEPRIIAAPITGQAVALALAVISMLLGLAALAPLDLVLVGRPTLAVVACR